MTFLTLHISFSPKKTPEASNLLFGAFFFLESVFLRFMAISVFRVYVSVVPNSPDSRKVADHRHHRAPPDPPPQQKCDKITRRSSFFATFVVCSSSAEDWPSLTPLHARLLPLGHWCPDRKHGWIWGQILECWGGNDRGGGHYLAGGHAWRRGGIY